MKRGLGDGGSQVRSHSWLVINGTGHARSTRCPNDAAFSKPKCWRGRATAHSVRLFLSIDNPDGQTEDVSDEILKRRLGKTEHGAPNLHAGEAVAWVHPSAFHGLPPRPRLGI